MDAESRRHATRYIWVAFFFGMVFANGNAVFNGLPLEVWNMVISIVIAGVALVSTGFVWNWGDLPVIESQSKKQSAEDKLKRGERVERLIELMDADELYELRRRLEDDYGDNELTDAIVGSDGELIQRR